jgi:hypothetical protein
MASKPKTPAVAEVKSEPIPQPPPEEEKKEEIEESPQPTTTIFDESDDDEPVGGEEYDMNFTYNAQYRNYDFSKEFKFYEFGNHPVSFSELLNSITTLRQIATAHFNNRHHHHSYHYFGNSGSMVPSSSSGKMRRTGTQHTQQPGVSQGTLSLTSQSKGSSKASGTKSFDIVAYQKAIDMKKSLPNHSKSCTIAAFHQKQNKWDGSFVLDSEIAKDLYRTPCRDPTGKVIFSLSRDPFIPSKGKPSWKPPDATNDLPEPTFEKCAMSFQEHLLAHMNYVIAKVEEEYRKMPDKTVAKSTLRAKVGADLNDLKLQQQKLLKEIEDHRKCMEAAGKPIHASTGHNGAGHKDHK